MAKDGQPSPDWVSHIYPRKLRREVMAMDGPTSRPARVLRVDRTSEQTRLQKQLMAAAYERVCPVIRRTLADEAWHRMVDNRGCITPPRTAAGARS
jgi:hypothetical protein